MVTQAWQGLDTLDNGVVIGGDEQCLGDTVADVNEGGAVYRFVPTAFYNYSSPAPVRPGQLCTNLITDLDQSPLVARSLSDLLKQAVIYRHEWVFIPEQ